MAKRASRQQPARRRNSKRNEGKSRRATTTERPEKNRANKSARSGRQRQQQDDRRASAFGSRRSQRHDSRRRRSDSDTNGGAPPKKKLPFILAGVAASVILLAVIAYGPIRRNLLFSDLRSPSAEKRAHAAAELARCGAVVVPRLQAVAENKSANPWPEDSRQLALQALVRLTNGTGGRAAKALERLLRDGKPKVRHLALAELAEAETAAGLPAKLIIADSRSHNARTRQHVATLLGLYSEGGVGRTLARLMADSDTFVATAAFTSMKRTATERDVPALIALLEKDKKEVRTMAKKVLVRLRSPQACATLARKLQASPEKLALEILDVLGQGANKRKTAAAIRQAITEHPSLSVRCKALEVAGKLRLRDTYDSMVEAAQAPEVELRVAAARAVEACGSLRHSGRLHHLFQDPEVSVRQAIIRCCWRLGDLSATFGFAKLLSDADPEVTRLALTALTGLFSHHAKRFGNDTGKWRNWAERYGEQRKFAERMRANIEKARELNAEAATNTSKRNVYYKKTVKLVEASLLEIRDFRKRKDLVPEFKHKKSSERQRLEHAETLLGQLLYTAKKLQTLEL